MRRRPPSVAARVPVGTVHPGGVPNMMVSLDGSVGKQIRAGFFGARAKQNFPKAVGPRNRAEQRSVSPSDPRSQSRAPSQSQAQSRGIPRTEERPPRPTEVPDLGLSGASSRGMEAPPRRPPPREAPGAGKRTPSRGPTPRSGRKTTPRSGAMRPEEIDRMFSQLGCAKGSWLGGVDFGSSFADSCCSGDMLASH